MKTLEQHVPTPRSCLDCEHCHISEGCPGYSEVTPGYDMAWGCGKDHWDLDNHNHSKKSIRAMFATARACKDFTPDKRNNT